jgi:hypothetical protein
MYNLLVAYDTEAWQGEHFTIDIDRFLEYTDIDVQKQFNSLDPDSINEIMRFPCIFAYEASQKKDPHFGLIKEIIPRKGKIRIQFELIPIDNFISFEKLGELLFELDLRNWELNRTHWAIKNIDLPRELHTQRITLPDWAFREKKSVDITKHDFKVAFSFPGEVRDYVEPVALELERILGPNSYFYDNNYKAQLARPSLDVLLQSIYKERSNLIVVFICEKYQEKKWCGIEFSVIREIIFDQNIDKIMYIKMDDGNVDGVLKTDGYIDGRSHSPLQIAEFIRERVELLQLK